MAFKVRDLMSNVLPSQMVMNQCGATDTQCFADTTTGQCDPCPPPSNCPGPSGCPRPSQKPPKVGLEMLSVLRDQMRQALLPA